MHKVRKTNSLVFNNAYEKHSTDNSIEQLTTVSLFQYKNGVHEIINIRNIVSDSTINNIHFFDRIRIRVLSSLFNELINVFCVKTSTE